ncbi:MAG: hypothetical protein ACYTGH_18030, partial [Planctomycetota bacterium]
AVIGLLPPCSSGHSLRGLLAGPENTDILSILLSATSCRCDRCLQASPFSQSPNGSKTLRQQGYRMIEEWGGMSRTCEGRVEAGTQGAAEQDVQSSQLGHGCPLLATPK